MTTGKSLTSPLLCCEAILQELEGGKVLLDKTELGLISTLQPVLEEAQHARTRASMTF